MKIYPILSSDIYALSCVPVSMLDPMGDVDLKEHLKAGGSLKFLVAQDTFGKVQTDTGFVSKHVEYATLSMALADDFTLDTLQQGVTSLSDYVKRTSLQQISVVIDGLPRPYIISAFHLSNGQIDDISGYVLSDALVAVVPELRYSALSADVAAFSRLDAPEIDLISSKIPPAATKENQLADKAYVSALVREVAPVFRGTFDTWAAVPSAASGYEPDTQGNHAPDDSDYMVVRHVQDYQTGGGIWPHGVPDTEKAGTWRFRYDGRWSDADQAASRAKWRPEYRIEQYEFTPGQIDTINSGVTQANRVLKNQTQQYGSATKGIYVNQDGYVVPMNFSLAANVPNNAKFTDTVPVAGDGLTCFTPQGGVPEFSLNAATAEHIGGIRVGKGLAVRNGTQFVDADTAVRVVEVRYDDQTSVEALAQNAFGDRAHAGAILVVKRGFRLSADRFSYTGYVRDASGTWQAMDGNCSAENVILPEDIAFSGAWSQVGNVRFASAGFFACGGKSVADAFRMIFGDGDQSSYIGVPAEYATYFMYDGEEHGPFLDYPDTLDDRIVVSGEKATNAGSYTCVLSLPVGQYKWSNGSTDAIQIPWEIGHMTAEIPDITLKFQYDSNSHKPFEWDEDSPFTVSGDSEETNIGEYECVLELRPNYKWSDGTFDPITVNWEIAGE